MGAGLKNILVVELFWKKHFSTNKQTNNMRGSQESTAQRKLANSDNILNTGGQLSEGLGDLYYVLLVFPGAFQLQFSQAKGRAWRPM